MECVVATKRQSDIADVRAFFATQMAEASGSADPRLRRAFEDVHREDFLGPGPWKIRTRQAYRETPTANPIHLYQNVLVALDADRGINNGEPFLHAAWIGAVAPKSGETVCHIGTGTGYYTAILSRLVMPDGTVLAFEIDAGLAAKARISLAAYRGVTVVRDDATSSTIPEADVIYVNAGLVAPPLSWLRALRLGGRLIFPWRPSADVALAMLVTRSTAGFSVKPLMSAWFIPCIGASDASGSSKTPRGPEAQSARSVWPVADRAPDDSAVAIYEGIWFSSETLRKV